MALVSNLFADEERARSTPVSDMFRIASEDRAENDNLIKQKINTIPIIPPGSVLHPDTPTGTPQLETGKFFQDLLKKNQGGG